MKLTENYHLTYCTNIHPGESWEEVEKNLKTYIPKISHALAPAQPFGIGLRLSHKASQELLLGDHLPVFKTWLKENDYYIFTLNGFPYGSFHRQVIKDDVHRPDWTTTDRVDYTKRLFEILAQLLPPDMDGGISTSPISYKFWYNSEKEIEEALRQGAMHLAIIAKQLFSIRRSMGITLHLDIEPEPDGLLENTQEMIDFFDRWLIPAGIKFLQKELNIRASEAEECIRTHIRLCYDVCHFAVEYEDPKEVFTKLQSAGIRIGKIQISAALKAELPPVNDRNHIAESFRSFVESTYLHQVMEKDEQGHLHHYNDLPAALENINKPEATEWRTHFHVPVFLKNYGLLSSTQEDILKVLSLLKKEHVTRHLEVETYTWEVLPEDIQLNLADSIIRELQWVRDRFHDVG